MNADDLINAATQKIAFNDVDLFSAVDPDSLSMANVYAAIAQAMALERIAKALEQNRADAEREYYRQELASLDDDEF